jgi:hypothetical protein
MSVWLGPVTGSGSAGFQPNGKIRKCGRQVAVNLQEGGAIFPVVITGLNRE